MVEADGIEPPFPGSKPVVIPLYYASMAVEEGFEPSVLFTKHGALAKLCLKPLGHSTKINL